MLLSQEQIKAIKRKRGELNLSVLQLSRETGVSRWTLDSIFKKGHDNVSLSTFKKLNDWLVKSYLE